MTFSLVGRCPSTGMFGAVVTSSSPAVAARCSWARARTGAACTQNVTDPTLGPKLLDAVAAGKTAQEALDEVVAGAHHPEHRQLSVVDGSGAVATFSGAETLGQHFVATGHGCAAAGNLLATSQVPSAMVDAFTSRPEEHLGDRLLAALIAGQDAGGEEGPLHSCGMLVVDEVSWPVTDLRVDWSDEPVDRLVDTWRVWKPQADDYVTRALHPAGAPSFGVPGDQ